MFESRTDVDWLFGSLAGLIWRSAVFKEFNERHVN